MTHHLNSPREVFAQALQMSHNERNVRRMAGDARGSTLIRPGTQQSNLNNAHHCDTLTFKALLECRYVAIYSHIHQSRRFNSNRQFHRALSPIRHK